MEFNLVSNLDEDYSVSKFNAYNHVIAWSLKSALQEQGHQANLVRDHGNEAPLADHTIVISAVAMTKIRDEPGYKEMLRGATKEKFALWLDADFSHWSSYFDRILTVVPPHKSSPDHYRWVGYAADPTIFYPDQKEKTAFVDSYMWGWYEGVYDQIYRLIQEVLENSGLKILQLVPVYNKGRRATWQEMIRAFRASHFHITTQIGNYGLTNIEAATCGAILVIHEDMNVERSWPFAMDHVTWKTRADLEAILASEPDIESIRTKALEHTWAKVIARVMEALQ